MVKHKGLGLVVILMLAGLISCTKQSTDAEPKKAKENATVIVAKSSQEVAPTADYKGAALINVELGLGYLQQGQVSRCKTKLTHALKLAPNIPEPHSAMAYFLEMVGEFKDAERHHKTAVRLAHSKGAVYNNYGAYLCRRTRFKEADTAFNQALEDKEYARTAEVYENAGICALKAANPEKATEYLTTAVRRDPNRSTAVLELAALEVQQGKLKEAKDLLARFRTLSEPSPRSLWLGFQVSKGLKDHTGMNSQVMLLKNLFENSPEYQAYLKSVESESAVTPIKSEKKSS